MPNNPPNLLFIFTDEQRLDTLSCYGNDKIQMPHLNRFAEKACVFEAPYCVQPVCTPSRSTLMTGVYPHKNGAYQNNLPLKEDMPCLPEMLDASTKYATGYHGKWHLGDEIFAQHGFQEWCSIEDNYAKHYSAGRDKEAVSTYHQWLISQRVQPEDGHRFGRGEACRLPEAYSKPAYLAHTASEFIERHKDEPWILYVNFLEPHMPFFSCRDGQYDPQQMNLPDNFDALPGSEQPLKVRTIQKGIADGHDQTGGDLSTKQGWQELISRYWGLCSLVDTHFGQILKVLDETGQAENTIVVFTSDHGEMMGSHQMFGKTVMYKESVQVPLLIRLPGQSEQVRVPDPVSQVDLVPTLLDLMGQPIPQHLHGCSLKPTLEAESASTRSDVVICWNGIPDRPEEYVQHGLPAQLLQQSDADQYMKAFSDPVRTIISSNGRWRLSVSPLGEHELYDLISDPDERRNVISEPDHQVLIHELLERLHRWQLRVDDAVELPKSIELSNM